MEENEICDMFEDLDEMAGAYTAASAITLALDGIHVILIVTFLVTEDSVTRAKLILYANSFAVVVMAGVAQMFAIAIWSEETKTIYSGKCRDVSSPDSREDL